ncbi:hypothetical protein SprV_0100029800 [Sparganum proliferum]
MQDAWTDRETEKIQGYAVRNVWKNFFSAIKAVYDPPTEGTAPHLGADGSSLLSEKTQVLQRWAEHFRGVLKRPYTISDVVIDLLPPVETSTCRPLSTKQSGPCSSSLAEERPDRTRSPLRSTSTVATSSWIILRRSSRGCGVKEKSRRISMTRQSPISTNGKRTVKSATATEASPC